MPVILSVNAGSSSVKVSVYEVAAPPGQQPPKQIAEAQISGLTAPPTKLTYKKRNESDDKDEKVHDGKEVEGIDSQAGAFKHILDLLLDSSTLPQLSRRSDIDMIAHRIVHGGEATKIEKIGPKTLERLEALSDLAPLHNAPSLEIVKACLDTDSGLDGATNVACFDTQFHASLPRHIRTYPIDQERARKNGLRKYGFHGISYSFITRAAAEHLDKPIDQTSLIALHLGSGASACAIQRGRSRDTSMGLTPLAGLPGATRSGSVDPSLVFHYASDVGRLSPSSTRDLHISRAEEMLNKECGWKALAGTTDFGEVAAAAEEGPDGNPGRDSLAFDLFVDRVCGFVGQYYVSLGGEVDALVFAGGIGEKSTLLREKVVEQCRCLGFRLHQAKAAAAADEDGGSVVVDIGATDARHRVLVCRTDEQFEMARMCAEDQRMWGHT